MFSSGNTAASMANRPLPGRFADKQDLVRTIVELSEEVAFLVAQMEPRRAQEEYDGPERDYPDDYYDEEQEEEEEYQEDYGGEDAYEDECEEEDEEDYCEESYEEDETFDPEEEEENGQYSEDYDEEEDEEFCEEEEDDISPDDYYQNEEDQENPEEKYSGQHLFYVKDMEKNQEMAGYADQMEKPPVPPPRRHRGW